MINGNESEVKIKNRSYRCDRNRPRPGHGRKYTKHKMSQYNDGNIY